MLNKGKWKNDVQLFDRYEEGKERVQETGLFCIRLYTKKMETKWTDC